jgi:hypothetical protein
MKRYLALMALAAALLTGGCADYGEPFGEEDQGQGPASHSPDPQRHIPQRPQNSTNNSHRW